MTLFIFLKISTFFILPFFAHISPDFNNFSPFKCIFYCFVNNEKFSSYFAAREEIW